MKKNTRTYLIAGLAALAAVAGGVALLNSDKTSAQKQSADTTGNGLIGKPLPNIQLTDKDGRTFSLESLKGKNAVLFFNEGLMCYPACWNQMVAFGTDPRFNSASAVAVSVVVDSPRDWQRAVAKMPDLARATTLFDRGAIVSRQLGVLSLASSMHPGQVPGHTYVLLDTQGIVREVLDDPNMGVNNNVIIQKIKMF